MRRTTVLLCTLSLIASTATAALMVESDTENVVSSRLAGTWHPHEDLTSQLGGHAHGTITFESNPSVVDSIPAMYEEMLRDIPIFMAGTMNRSDGNYPFLLVSHSGNTKLIYFLEGDGDPLGDAEEFNLVVAAAKNSENDLLFIGGAFNGQAFGAYKRVHSEVKSSLGAAQNQAGSISCKMNLKQIGLGFHIWNNDHGQLPFNLPEDQGGTREFAQPGPDGTDSNAYRHFLVMSNQFYDPRVLICPSDSNRTPAENWASIREANVSYILRSGSNVSTDNPDAILAQCPIHGHTLYCSGEVIDPSDSDD